MSSVVFLVGVVFRRRCDSSSAALNDDVPSSVGIRTVLPNKRRIDERLLEHIFYWNGTDNWVSAGVDCFVIYLCTVGHFSREQGVLDAIFGPLDGVTASFQKAVVVYFLCGGSA